MVISIQLSGLSFSYPGEDTPLFKDIHLTLPPKKIGIVGPNGCGKSTLLSLLAGKLKPSQGNIILNGEFDTLNQNREIYRHHLISEIFGVHTEWEALKRVRCGSIDAEDYHHVGDAWLLDEDIKKIISVFKLSHVDLDTPFSQLSGGEQTKILLSRLFYNNKDYLFLDEPSNHLDSDTKAIFFKKLHEVSTGLIIVSHDRVLLNEMDMIVALRQQSLKVYGGNYQAYQDQKSVEEAAIDADIQSNRLILKKAQNTFQTRQEKHQQAKAKGKNVRKTMVKKFGFVKDKMALDAKKGRSEKTNKRILNQGRRSVSHLSDALKKSQDKKTVREPLTIHLPKTALPTHKKILSLKHISVSYGERKIIEDYSFEMVGAERIALMGANGVGKTTLLNCLSGEIVPDEGEVSTHVKMGKLSQEALVTPNTSLTVVDYYLTEHPGVSIQSAHEVLAQFLFRGQNACLKVNSLSGGEMLRLKLAVLLSGANPPQCLLLDEPTNHLDLESVAILEEALHAYEGALIVVSHDSEFVKSLEIGRELKAPFILERMT